MTASGPDRPDRAGPDRLVVTDPRRASTVLAVRGALTVLFGLLAVIWPGITALALAVVFGVYALVDGVGLLADAVRESDRPHRGVRVLGGLIGIAAGIIALVWPAITALALAMLVGAWAVVTGAAEIAAAVRLRRRIRNELLLALAGLASVVASVVVLAWPAIGAVTIALVIGVYALVAGVFLLTLAARLRRLASHRGPA